MRAYKSSLRPTRPAKTIPGAAMMLVGSMQRLVKVVDEVEVCVEHDRSLFSPHTASTLLRERVHGMMLWNVPASPFHYSH